MIRIEVTGESIGEVADKLLAIGASLQGSRNPIMPEVRDCGHDHTPNAETVAALKEAQAATAKRNTKAAKEVPVVGEPTPTAETKASSPEPETPASASPAPTEPLDFDKDISPAVTGAVAKKGKPAVVEIIGQFGVARASEVPEERWPELLELLK